MEAETERPAADPLEAPPPAFELPEVARIAERAFGVSGSLSVLPSERDRNFRLDDDRGASFILKLQNPADGEAVVDLQTRALLHVARQDPELPVMRVTPARDGSLWIDVSGLDGRISQARLFTFLEGRNPEATDLDEAALRAWGATVARLGRALRGFFHPAAAYPILWDLKQAPRLRELLPFVRDDERRAAVQDALDRFESDVAPTLSALRAQVVHNDMSLDNVLVDEENRVSGITDFGDLTHTALVCDLAVTLADVLDGRADALEVAGAMIAGYESVTPLEDEEAALLPELVPVRCATAIVISAWRSARYPENADYIGSFDGGAWRFLRLVESAGRTEMRRRLLAGRRLPYRPVPTEVLLERRRGVMGPAPLSYDTPVHLARGEGVWLFDPEGGRYLDAYNNVPVVGHGHPRVVEAVAAQTRALNTNTRYLHEAAVELAERLVATMPPGLDRVLFVNSGSEANDVAWRIAKVLTGRRGAIVSEFAYHGVTEATSDLSPEEWQPGEAASRPRVALVPAPDGYRGRFRLHESGWAERYAGCVEESAAVLAEAGTPLAAMFVDSAFTSDGVLCPPPEYLRGVAGAVRRAGGLLVADEVQAGFGRFGRSLWSFQASGIEPDLVTLGKPMGNGFPIAAVVARSELVDPFASRTGFFSTFGGNPVACAAALAVLQVIDEEGLMANAADVGGHLRRGLGALMDRHAHVGDVRGRGLLVGVEMVRDRTSREPDREAAHAAVNGLRDRGILIGATGPAESVLKIRPPLVFTRANADLLVETLDDVLAAGTPA